VNFFFATDELLLAMGELLFGFPRGKGEKVEGNLRITG
jgi:hypothetical protein